MVSRLIRIYILRNKLLSTGICSFYRDHRTVFVGEDKGREYNWTVTDQPGCVVADHWIKDDGVWKSAIPAPFDFHSPNASITVVIVEKCFVQG